MDEQVAEDTSAPWALSVSQVRGNQKAEGREGMRSLLQFRLWMAVAFLLYFQALSIRAAGPGSASPESDTELFQDVKRKVPCSGWQLR